VSALANPQVGDYLNRHFVSAFQKVATFQIDLGQKQGGNVAGYFCTHDGRVLHAIAGPVGPDIFLKEAHWANSTYEMARLDQIVPEQLATFFRKAHIARLKNEHQVSLLEQQLPQPNAFTPELLQEVLNKNAQMGLGTQGQVHLLLTVAPTPRLHEVYRTVFETILNEKVSTDPVAVGGK
jgi:hypothetical protein